MSGLQWSENPDNTGKNYLYNENTGKKHKEDCKPSAAFQKANAALYGRAQKLVEDDPRKVRLFDTVDGVQFHRSQERIAHDIVENALKLGIKDPYNIQVVKVADFLIIR